MQPLMEPVVSNEKTISSGVGPSIGSGAGGVGGVTSEAVELSRDSGAISSCLVECFVVMVLASAVKTLSCP